MQADSASIDKPKADFIVSGPGSSGNEFWRFETAFGFETDGIRLRKAYGATGSMRLMGPTGGGSALIADR